MEINDYRRIPVCFSQNGDEWQRSGTKKHRGRTVERNALLRIARSPGAVQVAPTFFPRLLCFFAAISICLFGLTRTPFRPHGAGHDIRFQITQPSLHSNAPSTAPYPDRPGRRIFGVASSSPCGGTPPHLGGQGLDLRHLPSTHSKAIWPSRVTLAVSGSIHFTSACRTS